MGQRARTAALSVILALCVFGIGFPIAMDKEPSDALIAFLASFTGYIFYDAKLSRKRDDDDES